jgi:hypothetical protein
MDSAARTIVSGLALGQQDMIHAAEAQFWVVQTDGDTRTQQRIQDGMRPACRNFADVEAYPVSAM